MTLILDAAPLVALADAKEPQLEALLRIRDEEEGPLILPAPIAAEVDYLLGVRFGEAARRAFLGDLAAQRYDVACLEVVITRRLPSATRATLISASASPTARSWFSPSVTEPGVFSASTSAISGLLRHFREGHSSCCPQISNRLRS